MVFSTDSNRRRRGSPSPFQIDWAKLGGRTSVLERFKNKVEMGTQTVSLQQIAVVVLCFLMTFIAYVDRVGFSIAYTKMSDSIGTQQSHKGAVLSSFYWGYATSQIPCAWLAAKFGGVRMLTVSMLMSTIVAFITPGNHSMIEPDI